jgi:cytochrome c556
MKNFQATVLTVGMALLMSATALPAAAQFAKPEEAVKYRKAAFTLLGTHFSRVAAMANGKVPFDAKAAAENAEMANLLAKLPFTAFTPGSEKVGKSDASARIWTEMDKFKEGAVEMQESLAKLQIAAKTGNLDEIKAAVGVTSKTCKACHTTYKTD